MSVSIDTAANMVRTAPASFAQQRLWLAEMLAPGQAIYNVPVSLRLAGPLRVSAWRRALALVIARHETLRTRFEAEGPELLQTIEAAADVPVCVVDLRDVRQPQREAEVQRLVAIEARVPFDLSRTPLLRNTLVHLAPDEWACLITLHHTICDGWSMSLLTAEIRESYEALVRGREPALPALSRQYADYARAQRAWLDSPAALAEREYWARQLHGGDEWPRLRTDYVRPAQSSYRAGIITRRLSRTLSKELRRLGVERGMTLFMTLLAAFKLVLSRSLDEPDVRVGTFVAGRTSREDEPLIGLFVNTLVLRTDLSEAVTGQDLFERVRKTCAAAYAHQHVPFDMLVQLAGARQRGEHPLCQVLFAVHNVPPADLAAADLDIRPIGPASDAFAFDLALTVHENADTLIGELKFQRELFDADTAERLVRRWEIVLEALAIDPDLPLAAIDLTAADERQRLLGEWNDTARDYHAPGDLVSLLEAQAARTPLAEAVAFAGEQLSYQDLHGRANVLARALCAAGAGPERVVALLLDRSFDLIVAILATLKSGAAFLPLTPDMPAARIAHMLSSSHPCAIVTTRAMREAHPELAAFTTIDVTDRHAGRGVEAKGVAPPPVPLHAEHPAYVLYTSGSTGTPKGVVNVHGAIVNRLLWMQEAFELTASDRVLHKTPVTFDVSVWELLWPLMTGATLVLAEPGRHLDFPYLATLMRAEAITTLHFVPSVLRELLSQVDLGPCTSLRRVICSGEALSPEIVRAFYARSDAGLYNLYGPTEAAIDVSWWTCRRADAAGRTVPIGHPIANTRLYVMSADLRLVPPGFAGELYIGGVALARGYVDAPALTAERFVPDPFSREPGQRLYRTGDLVSFRSDGSVEYLGRLDQQVKVRGVRIELEEVEAAVEAHPSVACSAVTLRSAAPVRAAQAGREAGGAELVAFVVSRSDGRLDVAGIRRVVEARLPGSMAPARYVCVRELPRTSSGKIDRKRLRTMELPDAESSGGTPPRTELERVLARIWSGLLGVVELCLEDDFFELGGHSLLLTRVATRIREDVGVDVPLRDLFDTPRLGEMADLILAHELAREDEHDVRQLLADVGDFDVPVSSPAEPR
jgi:amino acid adenylation domain-containing protein